MEFIIIVLSLIMLSAIDIRDNEIADVFFIVFAIIVFTINYKEVGTFEFSTFAVVFTSLYVLSMVFMNIFYYIKSIGAKETISEDEIGFIFGEADMLLIALLSTLIYKNAFISAILITLLSVMFVILRIIYNRVFTNNETTGYALIPAISISYLLISIVNP